MAPKQPVRRRLGIDGTSLPPPPPAPSPPSDPPPKRKQGVRKRLKLDERSSSSVTNQLSSSSSSTANQPSSSTGYPSGGVRRRMDVNVSSPSPTPVEGPLNDTLRNAFGTNKLSAQLITEIINGPTAQGASGLPTLSASQHSQNLQRSMLSAFGNPAGAPPMSWRNVPTTAGVVPHPFFFPFDWLSSLYTARQELFTRTVRGPVGRASRFWSRMNDTPFDRLLCRNIRNWQVSTNPA